MELRHISYFLVVAAEQNFTRAAEHVGIGQPSLSLQIRDLERAVEARLFQASDNRRFSKTFLRVP